MRLLVIGGDGMLGHQLLLSWRGCHQVRVTLRRRRADYTCYGLFNADNSYDRIDVREPDCVRAVLADFRPDAVINAAGIIKHQAAARQPLPSLEVNAVFPHRLRLLCAEAGARMVTISTDCVFSGRTGNYSEQDRADAEDIYGLTKYLGEVSEAPALTLRTSIIGLELARHTGLIEWFLAQQGEVRGFTRAIYTGLTTAELARVIEMMLEKQPNLHGVWQVAAAPITKCELLSRLTTLLGRRDVSVRPDEGFVCDRSLRGEAFERETGYRAPDWGRMLGELARQIQERGGFHAAA